MLRRLSDRLCSASNQSLTDLPETLPRNLISGTLQLSQHILSRDDSGEVLIQVGKRHGVDLFRCMENAVGSLAIKGGGGIGDEMGVKAKIAGHSCGSFDTVIGHEASGEDRRDPCLPETLFQIRADKRAMDPLLKDRLAIQRPHDIF